MIGPGRYDDLCSLVRKKSSADGVILLIFSGKKGTGFSCQLPPQLALTVPAMLRRLANEIEEDKDSLLAQEVKRAMEEG